MAKSYTQEEKDRVAAALGKLTDLDLLGAARLVGVEVNPIFDKNWRIKAIDGIVEVSNKYHMEKS